MDGTPSSVGRVEDSSTAARPHRRATHASRTGATRRAVAYCSANDRNVPVLVPISSERHAGRQVSHRDAGRLVCLDFGVRCTGALCPLFQVPTSVEEPRPRPDGSGSH